jgi:hypothetical protein
MKSVPFSLFGRQRTELTMSSLFQRRRPHLSSTTFPGSLRHFPVHPSPPPPSHPPFVCRPIPFDTLLTLLPTLPSLTCYSSFYRFQKPWTYSLSLPRLTRDGASLFPRGIVILPPFGFSCFTFDDRRRRERNERPPRTLLPPDTHTATTDPMFLCIPIICGPRSRYVDHLALLNAPTDGILPPHLLHSLKEVRLSSTIFGSLQS